MNEVKKNEVYISAKTVEEFNKIKAGLNKLSDTVRNQIASAKIGAVGLECELGQYKFEGGDELSVWLPFGARQIQNFGDYIGIYVGDRDYFFVIRNEQLLKRKISYSIEDAPRKT